MNISFEKLSAEAEATGFRPDMLEKVAHLLVILEVLRKHPFLKGKLVLKGGTALNLFVFDVPRLSVDIDLNYLGAEDRESMLEERPKVEQAVKAVFEREGFTVKRVPQDHAGGKWSLRYQSAFGQGGNLEADINFMFRVPLWPPTTMDSNSVGIWQATDIQVLDVHELAAGKLAALFSRRAARDLFDCHLLLHNKELDANRLRATFVAYGAMNRKDWRTISIEDVFFDALELKRELLPTLRADAICEKGALAEYGRKLVEESRQLLSTMLPFTNQEREFLDLLLDKGEIAPQILTSDAALQHRIRRHPLLKWKAFNVKKHHGLKF
ncbi:MAG: nucleotidyl transferase AbiEii/AbiGii toxin family protein [Pseudomonadota bacterium]